MVTKHKPAAVVQRYDEIGRPVEQIEDEEE